MARDDSRARRGLVVRARTTFGGTARDAVLEFCVASGRVLLLHVHEAFRGKLSQAFVRGGAVSRIGIIAPLRCCNLL
jgi:hypothetical protein